jgi:hypothetical protein
MRLRLVRLPLMLFAALWLPVQAVAAQSMSVCMHGKADAAATMRMAVESDDASMADCPMHQAMHDPAPASNSGNADQCDQCGVCHLASVGFMSGPERATTNVPAERDYAAATIATPASNIPEPPQRPPRPVA